MPAPTRSPTRRRRRLSRRRRADGPASARRPSTASPSSTSRPGSPATTSSGCCAAASASAASAMPARSIPDATGVLLVGVGSGHPAAALPHGARQALHRRGRARRRDDDARRRRRGHRDATTWPASPSTRSAGVAAGTSSAPILQVPPMVGALKVDGRRLHELAREGIEVERAPRPVTVARASTSTPTDDPLVLRDRGRCSSGTYVRTLAADLGRAARRRRPPARAAAHRRRQLHGRRGRPPDDAELLPPARPLRDYGVGRRRRRRRRPPRRPRPRARRRPTPAAGPWARASTGGELLAVYEPSATGRGQAGRRRWPERSSARPWRARRAGG